MNDKEHRARLVATRIQALQAELAKIESEPERPRDDHAPGATVQFQHRFPTGKTYTYVAVKTDKVDSAMWFRSGSEPPHAGPGRMTWDQILEWAEPGTLGVVYPDDFRPIA